MLFFGKNRYRKNEERLRFYINGIISRAEEKGNTGSCRQYIMQGIDRMISDSRKTIQSRTATTDVKMIAYKVIYDVSFEVLRSGQMHIYRGMLNPMLPCDQLLSLVREALDYFVQKGEKDQATEQLQILYEDIETVG